MTQNQDEPPASGRRPREFDWDSPPGIALSELFISDISIRALRRGMNEAESGLKRLEANLEKAIREIKKITPMHCPEEGNSELNLSILLTPSEVAEKLGISRVALVARTREWQFPEPIHISKKKVAYRRRDIEDWMEFESKRLARQTERLSN